MPEPTGIMGISSLTGASDALSMLSNAATRTGVSGRAGQTAANRPVNANGQDFSTVIDTTAMSVMASAQLAPQVAAGMIATPMVTETRSYNTVEITTRSTSARGNDYTQPTAMGETRKTGEAEDALSADASFDGRLDAALSDAGAQMQQETAERMGVSEEQVAFAMQTAGLNPIELLTEDGITELVMEVTGEDQTALLTDEELYSKIRMLFEEAENLKTSIAEEFEVTLEGIEDAIAITAEGARQTQSAVQFADEVTQENAFSFAEHAGDATVLLQNARVQGRTEIAEKEIPEEETDFTVRGERTVQTERPEAAAQNENTGSETGNGGSNTQTAAKQTVQTTEDHTAAQQNAVSTAQNFVDAVNEAVNATQTVYGSGTPVPTEAENVLRQVLDQMRTTVREGMTEIDMQLHPQSLGRVNVNLQAMDGGEVVARFTAQTEAVREALASQMPQLLERFEEQGIKVNEVQVALAQEGFNQSRDNEMRREEQQNEQQAGIERAGRMRRVQMDLAGMTAEDIANLDEGERVEAEMMAAEGTTINYRG